MFQEHGPWIPRIGGKIKLKRKEPLSIMVNNGETGPGDAYRAA